MSRYWRDSALWWWAQGWSKHWSSSKPLYVVYAMSRIKLNMHPFVPYAIDHHKRPLLCGGHATFQVHKYCNIDVTRCSFRHLILPGSCTEYTYIYELVPMMACVAKSDQAMIIAEMDMSRSDAIPLPVAGSGLIERPLAFRARYRFPLSLAHYYYALLRLVSLWLVPLRPLACGGRSWVERWRPVLQIWSALEMKVDCL